MEQELKGKNFFKKLWTSIKDFEGYEEFAAEKISKTIIYLLLITLIFTLVIAGSYTYKFYLGIESAKNYINENIEEISLQGGNLNVKAEKEIIIEQEDNVIPIIIIDTSKDAKEEEYTEKMKAYDTGVLLLSDKIIIKSNISNLSENVRYDNILGFDIPNKESAINLLSGQNMYYMLVVFLITMFIYLFVIYLTSNIVDGIVLGALGYIFSRIMKIKLRYKATFNIGIHSLTLPIILNLIYIIVNTYTGFEIRYFQWMYTSISYIYVVVAILMIKTEIINQKIQLIKLREIQEKEAKQAEINEEKETEERRKEENKKEEDKEQKEKTAGEEPEGSNA